MRYPMGHIELWRFFAVCFEISNVGDKIKIGHQLSSIPPASDFCCNGTHARRRSSYRRFKALSKLNNAIALISATRQASSVNVSNVKDCCLTQACKLNSNWKRCLNSYVPPPFSVD